MTPPPDKPRLLVLASTFPRWRNDTEPPFVYELSRRLTDSFAVTVLAPRYPGSLEQETMDGLQIRRFRYFFRPWEKLAGSGGILSRLRANPLYYLLAPMFLIGQCWALIQLLRQTRWDIIHAHWLIPQGLTAVAARALARQSVPLVCTSHGGDLFGLRAFPLRLLKKVVMRASSKITVVSQAMREEVLAMGMPPDKVSVIPMGVDLRQRFTPDPEVERQPNQLLFVGRMAKGKGLNYLLQALPQVLQSYPEIRLTIAGGGPREADLKNIADSLNLTKHVEFIGQITQNELPDLYRQAAIFIAPFHKPEGLGMVVVEAIGCNCPVICGDVPAVRDIIKDGETGCIIFAANPLLLAEAIKEMLAHPVRREQMAIAAREYCLTHYDWAYINSRYINLLKNL